jgi:hypothetical protein
MAWLVQWVRSPSGERAMADLHFRRCSNHPRGSIQLYTGGTAVLDVVGRPRGKFSLRPALFAKVVPSLVGTDVTEALLDDLQDRVREYLNAVVDDIPARRGGAARTVHAAIHAAGSKRRSLHRRGSRGRHRTREQVGAKTSGPDRASSPRRGRGQSPGARCDWVWDGWSRLPGRDQAGSVGGRAADGGTPNGGPHSPVPAPRYGPCGLAEGPRHAGRSEVERRSPERGTPALALARGAYPSHCRARRLFFMGRSVARRDLDRSGARPRPSRGPPNVATRS